MTRKKAMIIGGGIAGPVTAMALQRAGIEPVVYEAYGTGAGLDAGAFLTVAVNGLDALRTLGAHEPVLAAGFPTTNIGFFSGTGRRLGEVPIGGTLPDGTVTHTIKRADLYRVLHDEAARRGVPIEHDRRLPAICSSAPTASTLGPAGSSTLPRPSPATRALATLVDLPATFRSTPGPASTRWSSESVRSSATRSAHQVRSGGSPTRQAPESSPGQNWRLAPRSGSGG